MAKAKLKHIKHNKVIKDYDRQKEKHLEKLATSLLASQEKNAKFKSKEINPGFLDLF